MKINSFLLRCTLIAALGGFLFGFETAVISGAEKTIQQLWSLSDFLLGFTVAASLIGTVIGSMIAGNPAQRYGRKKVLLVIALMYLLSALGCSLTPTWISVYHFQNDRRYCCRRFFGSGPDVYLRNFPGSGAWKTYRHVSVEYCNWDFSGFSDQFCFSSISVQDPGDGWLASWLYRPDCSPFYSGSFRKVRAG